MSSKGETNTEERRERLLSRLQSAQLRVTKFRRNLIELLIENEPYALSVDELHSLSTPLSPDLVTVYRNVEALLEIGILDRTIESKGPARYRLKENSETELKVSCRQCHATLVHNSPMISELEKVAHQFGYRELSSNWEIKGYCKDCMEERSG